MRSVSRLCMVVAAIGMLAMGFNRVVVAQDEPASVGVDASSMSTEAAAAERLQGAIKNLKYLHGAGGPTMYFIDLSLVIGVGFVLERFLRMRRSRVIPGGLLSKGTKALDEKDLDGAAKLAAKYKKSTLGKALTYLLESQEIGWEEREATVNEIASRDIDVHRMMCFPLAAIAGLSPLMGLLGTVSGIRECFRDVALAGEMGNPAMLAGGIEKALITTIYGLVVAIITLFCYNLFKFRMNLMANELEEVLSTIMGRHFKKKDANS